MMNFFRRLQSLAFLPKKKHYSVQRDESGTLDKQYLQDGLGKRGAIVHHAPEDRGEQPHFVYKDVRRNSDLQKLTAQIQRDLDETAAWVQRDLDETAIKIQIDLEKMEPFIQCCLEMPVDKVQRDLEEFSTKIQRDLEELVAKRQHSLAVKAEKIPPKLDGKDEKIQSDLDEIAAWIQCLLDEAAARIQSDLDEVAVWIQRDLDETAGWIQCHLEEIAAWIQLDLEKMESHTQHVLKVPVDKVQHDLEEISIQVQRDLQDLVAELQFSLEEKTEQCQPKLEEENEQVQHQLDETATGIETEMEKMVSHILYDLNVPADQFEHDLEDILIQIQRDLESSLEEKAEHIKFNLDESAAEVQPELEENAALIQSELGIKPTTPHCELLEQTKFHNFISLENFVLHKVLGKGSFGKVMLAELKESGQYFAIKALKKDSILANGYMDYLMTEKRVLKLAAESPFLAHLYFTFQTKDNLCFVMEYINGGDLFFHIEDKGRFDLVSTQFYAAEMTCGLQFLHRHGVIYRDLKLENVMLDRDGHIKIVDFGLSKDNMLGDKRALSFCGSEHYIAPEIFQGQHYFSPVDWWAFGVVIFEMLTGESPFYGADRDELCMSVCMDIPQYPNWINQESNDLLVKLLEKDPNHRLGTVGNIREHPFFKSIDWTKLEKRELEPPFKPKMVDYNDFRYFDEEFLKETPKMSQGDSSYIGPMDQSVFADFSFINSKLFCTY